MSACIEAIKSGADVVLLDKNPKYFLKYVCSE